MARISKLEPEKLEGSQKALYDKIVEKRGHVRGPYAVWIRRPELCEIVENLGGHLRWESTLKGRLSELALLITARHWQAAYPWATHEALAVKEGISQDVVDAIAKGEKPNFEKEDEAALYRFATEILSEHFVSDETYAETVRVLGEPSVVDLCAALGNFSMLSMLLNTFEVDLHPGKPEPFPEIKGYKKVK